MKLLNDFGNLCVEEVLPAQGNDRYLGDDDGVLYSADKTELVWYLPVVLQWMICLLSPVNGCGRYAFIVYLMTPFIMAVCLSTATDEVEEGEAEAAGAGATPGTWLR